MQPKSVILCRVLTALTYAGVLNRNSEKVIFPYDAVHVDLTLEQTA